MRSSPGRGSKFAKQRIERNEITVARRGLERVVKDPRERNGGCRRASQDALKDARQVEVPPLTGGISCETSSGRRLQ